LYHKAGHSSARQLDAGHLSSVADEQTAARQRRRVPRLVLQYAEGRLLFEGLAIDRDEGDRVGIDRLAGDALTIRTARAGRADRPTPFDVDREQEIAFVRRRKR
jgi:hypothetical protein